MPCVVAGKTGLRAPRGASQRFFFFLPLWSPSENTKRMGRRAGVRADTRARVCLCWVGGRRADGGACWIRWHPRVVVTRVTLGRHAGDEAISAAGATSGSRWATRNYRQNKTSAKTGSRTTSFPWRRSFSMLPRRLTVWPVWDCCWREVISCYGWRPIKREADPPSQTPQGTSRGLHQPDLRCIVMHPSESPICIFQQTFAGISVSRPCPLRTIRAMQS